ncbi:hypothetical protein GOP47_0008260 [Adiantum capillus-veneris]|uniref:Aldose 1-epimerase n=1 Tax=Adiantum capillus-veneris TaxID=13818 RepID=A0A9D4ZKI0_ADICA|nr:hypothetical protein GOP47_0008260 [Adiantum capillus-veneris]
MVVVAEGGAARVSEVQVREFGRVKEGRVVVATLRRGPVLVEVINWGARIIQLHLPDAHAHTSDVVLGFDNFKAYQNASGNPYFGAIVGRVANRIAGGSFELDNVHYNISKNEGNNTLHGGKIGFDKVLWDTEVIVDKVNASQYVQFTYNSYDGEQGFPGDVKVQVTYRLTSDMDLLVHMTGKVGNKSTPLNLAQHTYWNLGGHNSGTILNNTIQIVGDKITQVDDSLIPTGQLKKVAGTPYDFRMPRVIGSQIDEVKVGYDINYQLKRGKAMKVLGGTYVHLAAKVRDPKSSRAMEVYTNQVGVQFYTGNYLDGIVGKGGVMYKMHDALCLETQGFPDAVHHPNFPSIIVPAHHEYQHIMLFRFSVE